VSPLWAPVSRRPGWSQDPPSSMCKVELRTQMDIRFKRTLFGKIFKLSLRTWPESRSRLLTALLELASRLFTPTVPTPTMVTLQSATSPCAISCITTLLIQMVTRALLMVALKTRAGVRFVFTPLISGLMAEPALRAPVHRATVLQLMPPGMALRRAQINWQSLYPFIPTLCHGTSLPLQIPTPPEPSAVTTETRKALTKFVFTASQLETYQALLSSA